jgi:hypothetical protein
MHICTTTLRCFFKSKWTPVSELTVNSNKEGPRKGLTATADRGCDVFETVRNYQPWNAFRSVFLHVSLIADTQGCWPSVSMGSGTTQRTAAPSRCYYEYRVISSCMQFEVHQPQCGVNKILQYSTIIGTSGRFHPFYRPRRPLGRVQV